MTSDFFLGRRWKVLLFSNVAWPVVLAVTTMLKDVVWWRMILALGLLGASGWFLYMYRRAIHGPLIAFKPDELVVRSIYEREVTRIPRAGVEGVAWANPGTICLQLRSGPLQAVNLIGLDRRDKELVRTRLESWRDGA